MLPITQAQRRNGDAPRDLPEKYNVPFFPDHLWDFAVRNKECRACIDAQVASADIANVICDIPNMMSAQ